MTIGVRIAIAAAIVLLDLALFVVPLFALLAAFIIIVRPPWFRDWVERLYHDVPTTTGAPGA